MKIVHVELGRFLYGGAQQVRYLLDGLAARGVENVLVCAKGSEIASRYKNPAVAVRPVPLSVWDEADLRCFLHILRILRTERPDLVHVHCRRGNFPAALAAHFSGVPAVMSHRIDSPRPCAFDRRIKFPLYRRIVAISDGIRDVLKDVGVPETRDGAPFLSVVKSAVDTDRFRPAPDRAWFAREFDLAGEGAVKGAVIGVNASLIPRKGHRVLLAAMPKVVRRHPDCRVLLFGKGRLEEELRRTVETTGLAANVRLMGYRTDLERILPNLDFLVHPALKEGLGVAVLEAAACGIAVVASRAGGIPEAVRDGASGLLVPPGDAPALAAAIERLIDRPDERRNFGACGRALAMKDFSIARMVEGNLAVYGQVLAVSPRR